MYMYVCVCMYVCMYVCSYVYCVCTYACMYVRLLVYDLFACSWWYISVHVAWMQLVIGIRMAACMDEEMSIAISILICDSYVYTSELANAEHQSMCDLPPEERESHACIGRCSGRFIQVPSYKFRICSQHEQWIPS